MHCDIVSAEKEIFSGRVTFVGATGSSGELGIMPGHTALLTGIAPGPVRLTLENGEDEIFFASGGYLEVQPNVVTILADTAVRAEDIDEAAAAAAREQAEEDLAERAADIDYSVAAARFAEAMARQRTVAELRKRKR